MHPLEKCSGDSPARSVAGKTSDEKVGGQIPVRRSGGTDGFLGLDRGTREMGRAGEGERGQMKRQMKSSSWRVVQGRFQDPFWRCGPLHVPARGRGHRTEVGHGWCGSDGG